MPRIQNPELANALRLRYSLKGAAPIDTLAPEIVPITIVDSLLEATPELEIPMVGEQLVTGGGATIAEIGLRTGDVDLLRVSHAVISASSATQVRLRTGAPAGTVTSIQTRLRDGRRGQGGTNLGLVPVANDHAAGSGSLLGRILLPANTPFHVDLGDWLIDDDSEIHFDCLTVNISLLVVWFYTVIVDPALVP